MADVTTYNISRVSIILGGLQINKGFAEGDVISFVPEGPAWEDKKGADGEVTRYATNERRFTATLRMMQSSSQNAILSGLLNAGILAANGSDVAALLIKDDLGTTVIASGKAWLKGFPTITFGQEVGPREWEIRGVWDLVVQGGN